jgi:hypothetical protein
MERDELYHLKAAITMLEARVGGLEYELRVRDIRIEELAKENALLRKRLEEQKPPSDGGLAPPVMPPWVKPSVPPGRRKKPGRKSGHEASLRPPPKKIDKRVQVPLPADQEGRPVCPHCRTRLLKLRRKRRLVEDLVPPQTQVTCYHTRSGYCPLCRKRVESRAPEQPPAASLPHAQMGINALATAVVLRLENRLPFRQVTQLLGDVANLKLCAGAVSRQVRRLGRWLKSEHQRMALRLRQSDAVHADETGWRTNGRNGWLWTICDQRQTFYHVDDSRGGGVIRRLLGEAFGGTLVSDFYGAYDTIRCKKQKCLTHLLRELRDTAAEAKPAARDSPAFAAGRFYPSCKRLLKDLLRLKRRWDDLNDATYTRRACRLEDRLQQLAEAHADDPEPHAHRLALRVQRYQKQLTAFLWDQHLDGTNNAAERALRPAVVMRKITGGSRSPAGAEAWATMASVLRTARQQRLDVLQTLKQLLIDCWAGKESDLLASS